MITYEKWQAALSDEAMAGVAAMFDGAKNKNTCIDLIRWFTATGRVWRTRDGLNIVRGSVKGRPDGMKEDPFLQSIGITAAKIRGFIKLALERGVLEILSPPNQPDEDGDLWRYNRNGRPRNPAIVYRFSKSFLATLRKGQSRQESGTRVALQAVAKPSCSSSVLAPIDEGYSGIRSSGGYLPSAPFPAPRATPRIPLPPKAPAVPVQPQPLPSAPVQPKKPILGRMKALFEVWQKAVEAGADPILSKPACFESPKKPLLSMTRAEIREEIEWVRDTPHEAVWNEEDRTFAADYPELVRISPETWPQVYDDALEIRRDVSVWLLENAGVRGHHVRWCKQPGVAESLRGIAPWDLKQAYGLDQVLHVGFKKAEIAVAFRMAFGGIRGAFED